MIFVEELPTGNLAQYGPQQVPLSPDYGYIGEDDQPVYYDNYNPAVGPPGSKKCFQLL